MCSIDEDFINDDNIMHCSLSSKTQINEEECEGSNCHKCSSPNAVYKLQFRQAECCNCFLTYVQHKFRATLGSSKLLPKNAKVLLIFNGKPESLVLLDMLYQASTQNDYKKLYCSVYILYVDDYLLQKNIEGVSNNYQNFMKSLKNCLNLYKMFDSYIIPVADIDYSIQYLCNIENIDKKYLMRDNLNEFEFLHKLNDIKSLTSRQDFLKFHLNKLLASAAKQLNCQFIFKSNINTELAVDLLSAVCLGRGSSALLEISLMDDRLGDNIRLLRPLRNFSRKEIDLYIKARNIMPFDGGNYDDDLNKFESIQNFTKSFIHNLEQDFTSTVLTIGRVGEKMTGNRHLRSYVGKSQVRCTYCNSIVDHVDSTRLSAIKDEAKTISNIKPNQASELFEKNCEADKLCYACQNIFRDSS